MEARSHPSLDDAFARLERAREHIRTLEGETGKAERSTVRATTGAGVSSAADMFVPDKIIPILIGECVFNLRAALDYLVYETYFLNNNRECERTEFPIIDEELNWGRDVDNRKYKGERWFMNLRECHRAKIKSYQPFNGVKWTKGLRCLSNVDKHRRLTLVNAEFEPVTRFGTSLMMLTSQPALIAFENGPPIIEGLVALADGVEGVLRSFEPDFR